MKRKLRPDESSAKLESGVALKRHKASGCMDEYNDWQEMIKEASAFWHSKLEPRLHIDSYAESDHPNETDLLYGIGGDMSSRRHNRILNTYYTIMQDTKSLLYQKLKECKSIAQKLSHLVSFIPIFEPFSRRIAWDLTEHCSGEDRSPNYDYHTDQIYASFKENELKPNEQERKFIFEQINKVIPSDMYIPHNFEMGEYFDDNPDVYDPFHIDTASGYLVSCMTPKSSTALLRKLNDFILLKSKYLTRHFFITEKLTIHLHSIPEYVSFLSTSTLTNEILFGDEWLLYDVVNVFEKMNQNNEDWIEVAGRWLHTRYEHSNHIQSKLQLIESLMNLNEPEDEDISSISERLLAIITNDIDIDVVEQMGVDKLVELILTFIGNHTHSCSMLNILCQLSTPTLIAVIGKLIKLPDNDHAYYVHRRVVRIDIEGQPEMAKDICSRILHFLCKQDDTAFSIDLLERLCQFVTSQFVYKIFDEALKCGRNRGGYQSFGRDLIGMFVECICRSCSDVSIQTLIMEMNNPRQITEHFYNSVSAIAFVSGAAPIAVAQKCDVLKRLCLSILKICNTFWADRELTIEQNRQVSNNITKLSGILVPGNLS
eukprot:537413_1